MSELSQFENVLLEEVKPGVLLLTINRPKVLNALNAATLKDISAALDVVESKDDARVLLVTGAGEKSFVAGADISHMKDFNALEAKAFSEQGMRTFRRMETLHIPAIALVNGYALGGGCELAMSCDFILASDNARFGQPEVNLGVAPGFGGTQRLNRRVGTAFAMELLVSARTMKADEAMQRGLVNHVYPQVELMEEGLKLAELVASKSRSAVQLTKELVQRGQDLDLENACAMETDLFALCFSTEDQKEGMAAFLENRKANF